MANNIAVTEGSGKTVATEDIGGFQYQKVKIVSGATPTEATFNVNGQTTLSGGTPVSPASDWVGAFGGNVANDAVDSGNPVKVGAIATSTLSTATLVSAADRVNFVAGTDGAQIVRINANLADVVSGNASNTDGTATQVIATAGSGIKQYLMGVTLTNTSAAMIYVELKSGTTVKWTCPVPATGGYTYSWPLGLPPNAANEAWNFDPSAATTTVYCSATAFKSLI